MQRAGLGCGMISLMLHTHVLTQLRLGVRVSEGEAASMCSLEAAQVEAAASKLVQVPAAALPIVSSHASQGWSEAPSSAGGDGNTAAYQVVQQWLLPRILRQLDRYATQIRLHFRLHEWRANTAMEQVAHRTCKMLGAWKVQPAETPTLLLTASLRCTSC